jgi:hypothetical protein
MSLVALLCFLTAPVKANTDEVSATPSVTILNEYEYIKALKAQTDEELKKNGFSDEEVKKVKELDYKKELKERSKLANEKLKNMGYTKEQIKLLREYDGSEESVQALAATATITSNLISASSSQYKVNFNWSWSSCPVYLLDDVISCVWKATNQSGANANIAYTSANHTIYYKMVETGYTYSSTGSITRKDDYHMIAMYFDMGDSSGTMGTTYAYKGGGSVTLTAPVSGSISEIMMRFEYGHTYVAFKPSVSFSSSGSYGIGVSYSYNCSMEDYSMHRYTQYGQTLDPQ